MAAFFPISIPERLPVRIEPGPIVEAIFEARFVDPESCRFLDATTLRRNAESQMGVAAEGRPEQWKQTRCSDNHRRL